MRLAVLDVGSNTIHLVVDGQADGTFTVVGRERDTLRLAEAAFPSMRLPAEAVGRLMASVARMRAAADALQAGTITGFATSAIREARNGLDVLGQVQEATGVAIKVLPGVEEARLTYLADRIREAPWEVTCATPRPSATSARWPRRCRGPYPGPRVRLRRRRRPDRAHPHPRRPLRGRRLPGRHHRPRPPDPHRPGRPARRQRRRRLPGGRPHHAGLRAARAGPGPVGPARGRHLDTLGELGPAPEGPPGAPDPRRRSVLDFARRHAWDEAHCRQVTALALSLFDQTIALHGLGPPERELLEAAGLLHDVGYAVAQSSRHKHSLYLIRNAALDGWSARAADDGQRRPLPPQGPPVGPPCRLHGPGGDRPGGGPPPGRPPPGRRGPRRRPLPGGRGGPGGRRAPRLRLELRARDAPDLWSASQNADLFEAEFTRQVVPVATEVV